MKNQLRELLSLDVSRMRALDKGFHLPFAFAAFATFFTYMVVRDLRTGEIWRGGPAPTIALAGRAEEFYSMIAFFSVMAALQQPGEPKGGTEILNR